MPKISVIMAAYNAEKTIGYAINSIINQSFQDFEILICDDFSTDNTISVVKSYSDKRIRLFSNSSNIGPGESRDFLIDQAEGEWVATIDADDIYMPNRLEIFWNVAQKSPGAVIFDEIMECHDIGEHLVPWKAVRKPSLLAGAQEVNCEINPAKWLRCERTILKWMVPRDLIRKNKIKHPNVRFGEDLGFALRLLCGTGAPLWYIPETLYLYRLSDGSLKTSADRFEVLLQVLNEAKNYDGLSADLLSSIIIKIKKTEHRIKYQKFLNYVLEKRAMDAMRIIFISPWVIPEFFLRLLMQAPYYLHRKFNKTIKKSSL